MNHDGPPNAMGKPYPKGRRKFQPPARSFQGKVWDWLNQCFGKEISESVEERNHRFLEESLELVQACGCTKEECLRLVDYVYNREEGHIPQEVGGVLVCLAALCEVHKVDMTVAGMNELHRIWPKIEQIRAKQAAKPYMGNKE